jgi:hypothetical protein
LYCQYIINLFINKPFIATTLCNPSGPRLSGALGSLRRWGKEEQGGSEGLLEALHAGKGMGTGKKKMRLG